MTEGSTRMELIRAANARIAEISTQLNQLGRELSANQQSTTGLWKEVAALKRSIDKVHKDLSSIVVEHEEKCIAHQRAMAKAMSADSSTEIERQDPSTVFNLPLQSQRPVAPIEVSGESIKISRPLIVVALILGAMLVGGGIMLGAAWAGGAEGAGDTIRGLSGDKKPENTDKQ